jgi:hypothetical protein
MCAWGAVEGKSNYSGEEMCIEGLVGNPSGEQ